MLFRRDWMAVKTGQRQLQARRNEPRFELSQKHLRADTRLHRRLTADIIPRSRYVWTAAGCRIVAAIR